MSVPSAVKRQAKAADQMVRDLAAGRSVAAPAPAAPSAPGTAPEPNLPNVGEVPPGFVPGAPAASAQPAAPAAPAPAAPAPSGEPAPSAQPAAPENYEHKYRTLQGKYNAEMPRMLEALNETRTLLDQASRQNQELLRELSSRNAAPAAPSAPTRREETFGQLVTEKEREAFGDDLIDVVGRRAKEVVLPEIQQLIQRELQPLKTAVGQTAARTAQQARDAVYKALNDVVPNWQTVNDSVEFLAWLEGMDVFSGRSRRDALTHAFNSYDASRVVGIFQAYLREDASSRPTAGPLVDPATLVAPGVPRGGSADEVAPGGSRGKIWSENEIKSFYDRVRKRQVKPEEYASTQAELAAAAREGRIRPDRPDFHLNQR